MTGRRWWIAAFAAVAGIVILAVWFGAYGPTNYWGVLSRTQLAEKGRNVTRHFGLNTSDWKVYEVARVYKELAHYGSEHPLNVSPLSVRVTYVAREGGQKAEIGFDSRGHSELLAAAN